MHVFSWASSFDYRLVHFVDNQNVLHILTLNTLFPAAPMDCWHHLDRKLVCQVNNPSRNSLDWQRIPLSKHFCILFSSERLRFYSIYHGCRLFMMHLMQISRQRLEVPTARTNVFEVWRRYTALAQFLPFCTVWLISGYTLKLIDCSSVTNRLLYFIWISRPRGRNPCK